MSSLLQRLAPAAGAAPRARLHFVLDGRPVTGLQGDTVLTAVLTQTTQLRQNGPSGAARAGFCLMGACQDCWLQTEDGQRIRACSTLLVGGMRLLTGAAP